MSVDIAPLPAGDAILTVRIAQRTDTGRVRAENQDYLDVSHPSEDSTLLIVADGMGGHRGGATASRLAASEVASRFAASTAGDPRLALMNAFLEANDVILGQSQQSQDLRGMGTTCSALLVTGRQAYTAHVGDSRVYRVRRGATEQLTDDHSLVASMVREGLLTSEEAEVHPRRNVLQRSVGVASDLEVDVSEPFDVVEGDLFLLCSDGLHGLVRPEEMAAEVERSEPAVAVQSLVEMALDRGAPDNVTLIVAQIVAQSGKADDVTAPAGGMEVPAARGRGSWSGWLLLALLLLGVAVTLTLVLGRSGW